MSKIRVMNENMANMIAAGEVIEKCASIVKELVENAIDAQATVIKVSLVNGGISEIKVVDNGIGMDKEDAILSFSRHATSKIYKTDDLFFIETLGFRGEALASIAAVSEVVLETSEGQVGTCVHIKGGEIIEVRASEARKGTSFTITNLFYNTPARLKYLKSEATECNNSLQFMERLALSRPDIALSLTNNEKVLLKTSGSGNLLKTIHEIYGLNVSSNMLEIKAFDDDFEISGYIAKPSILKKNRNHMHTIVNGRIVRNNELNRAINDAYNTYKHEGFYPVVVINIDVDPTLVDVNIHPTKQDIKMSKLDNLTNLIYRTIKDTLYENLLIPDAIFDSAKNEIKDNFETYQNLEKQDNIEKAEQVTLDVDYLPHQEEKETTKNSEFKNLKLNPIGQVHRTYIIAEDAGNMYILDQHAAHERINYEMITKKFQEENVSTINMLVPLPFELNPSDYNTFMERKETLEQLGFSIEEFGINTIAFKSHPTWLKKGFEEESIRSIVDFIITNDKKFEKSKFLDSIAKMISCKMSVKANEDLSQAEMEKLLNDLVKCDNPYNCCHGRPSIMKYSTYELEKMFRRVM